MKLLNHRGSAALLVLTLLLAALLILSALGINGDWKPRTTPWRLVNDPFAGWALLFVLCTGLASLRVGTERLQCVSALLFIGVLWGLGLASAFFWDPWLPNVLLLASFPVLRSARQTLVSVDLPGQASGAQRPARRTARHGN